MNKVITDEILRSVSPTVADTFRHWRSMLYDRVDFNMPQSRLHSYAHTERVLLHALNLASAIYGDNASQRPMEVLAHAALFHDTRRQDEYIDRGHGARGAVAYEEFCHRNKDMVYHPEAAYLMRYHDIDDSTGVEQIKAHFGKEADDVLKLYAIFKDADALDRGRLGSLGLDEKFLRTDAARANVSFANRLVAETVDPVFLQKIDRLVHSSVSRKMLLVIDPQVDFIDGTLPVPGAHEAMDHLALYIGDNEGMYKCKIVSADRHPYDHLSFRDNGGEWPRHCVHDSVGAAIWPAVLDALYSTAGDCHILHKGEKNDREEYSIFESEHAATAIQEIVSRNNITDIDICGLAGDICVLSSLRQGLEKLPGVRFNVLTDFSPSIDGGAALGAFIRDHLPAES